MKSLTPVRKYSLRTNLEVDKCNQKVCKKSGEAFSLFLRLIFLASRLLAPLTLYHGLGIRTKVSVALSSGELSLDIIVTLMVCQNCQYFACELRTEKVKLESLTDSVSHYALRTGGKESPVLVRISI